MINLNKTQYREFSYINNEVTEKIIKSRRTAVQSLNGKKPSNNISSKPLLVLNSIFTMVLETGENELMVPKSQLVKILNSSNVSRDLKTYFRGYGLGEYSYSNKYNITVNGERKTVKRETHYYIYINKETLELMKGIMTIEGVDFDALIAQIPECERKCAIIGSKTETEVNILNYVDDDFIMTHKINIEKNLFTKEGHYRKETSVINTENDSVVKVNVKENDFIPKDVVTEEEVEAPVLEEEIEEMYEEIEMTEEIVETVEEIIEVVEEVLPEEDIEDVCISLSKRNTHVGCSRRMPKVELKGGRAFKSTVNDEPEIEEAEEIEEETNTNEVTMETVSAKMEQLRELQTRMNSRVLTMEINKVEKELENEDLDIAAMFNRLEGLLDKFAKYESNTGFKRSSSNTGVRKMGNTRLYR